MTVTASDGNGGSDTVTVTITLTDVNEPPGFDTAGLTTGVSGTVLFSVAENGTAVGTLSAADPDAADTTVTYTLGGTDASVFSISTAGAIAFDTAPDFESPGCGTGGNSNTCTVTVTASAGGTGRAMSTPVRTVTVTVTDVAPPARPAAPVFGDRTAEQHRGELAGAGQPGLGHHRLRRALPRGDDAADLPGPMRATAARGGPPTSPG